jgi:hypothetical protein
MDLAEAIKQDLLTNCNFNDSYRYWFYAMVLFVPVGLTFVFFGISYYTKELYYFVLSCVLALDIFLNFFVSGLYFESAPLPQCGGSRAFPAFKTEHSTFLYNFMMLSNFFFLLKLDEWAVFWLQVWVLTTWIASVELGYNNFRQALVGAIIGQAFSFFLIVLVAAVMKRYRKYFVHNGIMHWLGYHDTIFENDETIRVRKHELYIIIDEIEKNQKIPEPQIRTNTIWNNLVAKLSNTEIQIRNASI